MFFAITLRRLLHAAAALSVLLTWRSHLPPEWRSEIERAAHHALGDVAAATPHVIAHLWAM